MRGSSKNSKSIFKRLFLYLYFYFISHFNLAHLILFVYLCYIYLYIFGCCKSSLDYIIYKFFYMYWIYNSIIFFCFVLFLDCVCVLVFIFYFVFVFLYVPRLKDSSHSFLLEDKKHKESCKTKNKKQ